MHVCLNCMVVSGNAEKYEELRASYNSVIDNKVPRAPPFTEFRGMSSICGNVFCKWVLFVVLCRVVSGAPCGACCLLPAREIWYGRVRADWHTGGMFLFRLRVRVSPSMCEL